VFEPAGDLYADLGVIVQGGMYNTLMRALEMLGLADGFGAAEIPIYVLNVAYPLIDDELEGFCAGKRAVLLVEEGQPEFIEQALHAILRRAGVGAEIVGKGPLPRAGEYTGQVLKEGVEAFLVAHAGRNQSAPAPPPPLGLKDVPARPPGFCTGCPERPVFTAMKLVEKELGPFHVSCDIGCHLFSILPPFNIGNTTMGYGLGWSGAAAFNVPHTDRRTISVMGDGGFWHNGLTSGVGGAVFNKNDNVLIIIDNGYSAATGGQDILSSRPGNVSRSTEHAIAQAVRGVGVEWVRTVRTYDLGLMRRTLKEALTTKVKGPKVIVAQAECMLNRQRREKPLFAAAVKAGKRVTRQRFGVDEDVCTGDHSCIRLSGCPSLTTKPNPDSLRQDPVAHVNNDCVGCGVCGEIAHAAVLCPSFYRADILFNPTAGDRRSARWRQGVIGALQGWAERRRLKRAA
jgi:indolepyruvate ferredoxin oxidoreductase alpha subunit